MLADRRRSPSMPAEDLVDLLLQRLRTAGSKTSLQDLLRAVNEEQELKRGELKITGNLEELLERTRDALSRNWLGVERLSSLVDSHEENGGQHVFLFDVTAAGLKALKSKAFRANFDVMPSHPTAAMYAELPQVDCTYFSERPDALVIKQVYRTAYWEKDEDLSSSTDTVRTTISVRRERRALNLFRLMPEEKKAEIRVDRVRGEMDDSLALTLFSEFLDVLSPVVDAQTHLQPTKIWHGFTGIVADQDHTYMSTDTAQDASVAVRMSNRREDTKGQDVRNHPDFKFIGPSYSRKNLNVYWLTEYSKIHTILSHFEQEGRQHGKVYVGAKISAEELTDVTERIRQFAR